jgi:hypothetical protein
MIRIREIVDPELRRKITEALAERRGCSAAGIPDWFEGIEPPEDGRM